MQCDTLFQVFTAPENGYSTPDRSTRNQRLNGYHQKHIEVPRSRSWYCEMVMRTMNKAVAMRKILMFIPVIAFSNRLHVLSVSNGHAPLGERSYDIAHVAQPQPQGSERCSVDAGEALRALYRFDQLLAQLLVAVVRR
ncbi:hypothetical protein EVAR_86699_1 [Eumeta japonica]|uniref:Uncharacterized protein n=1 Tax=Eumeta variegata TaxID=151549 RepID=A0A4C1XXM8_EUMVA|nr:hypothetical protein EVAR_86699_1 [Eumeta japonica]